MESIDKNTFSGIVVALKANYLEVELDLPSQKLLSKTFYIKGLVRFLCTRRSRLDYQGDYVNVGDYVTIESINLQNSRAVVSKVEPRKTLLSRPAVANVTQVIVVLSFCKPTFDLDQACRFLISAEENDLDVCLLLNKRDLLSEDFVQEQLNRLRSWGYKTIAISTITGQGFSEFKQVLLDSSLTVLSGPSGVGKTSLLNALLPNASLKVGALSERLERGRHTTRHVELYTLEGGARIADTPGFNRPKLPLDPKLLQIFFPELRSQLANYPCKFRDCMHIDEMGCGVEKTWERYNTYKKFLGEIINYHR